MTSTTHLSTKSLCNKTLAAICSLQDEQKVFMFIDLVRGKHQKVPEGRGANLVFISKENDLISAEIAGVPKTLFYIYKESEKQVGIQAIKVCAKELTFQTSRANACAIKQLNAGTLDQELVHLFDNYKLNHPFPWRLCADGESVLCRNNKVVVSSKNLQAMQLMVAISQSGASNTVDDKKVFSNCY